MLKPTITVVALLLIFVVSSCKEKFENTNTESIVNHWKL